MEQETFNQTFEDFLGNKKDKITPEQANDIFTEENIINLLTPESLGMDMEIVFSDDVPENDTRMKGESEENLPPLVVPNFAIYMCGDENKFWIHVHRCPMIITEADLERANKEDLEEESDVENNN
jgi:hypothetical protein